MGDLGEGHDVVAAQRLEVEADGGGAVLGVLRGAALAREAADDRRHAARAPAALGGRGHPGGLRRRVRERAVVGGPRGGGQIRVGSEDGRDAGGVQDLRGRARLAEGVAHPGLLRLRGQPGPRELPGVGGEDQRRR